MLNSSPPALLLAALNCALLSVPPATVAASTGSLDSAAELVGTCRALQQRPESAAAGLCRGYLLGYLAASPDVAFKEDLPSSYMQRVLRTRAPDHPRTRMLKEARFCLEHEADLAEIARSVAAMDPESVADSAAADILEQVLQRDFSCST